MYDSVFGLKRAPFSAVVDWRCCATIPSFRAAYGEITNCLTGGRGIAVLTAPAGTGKSLLCQLLAEELMRGFRVVLLPSGGFETRAALLQAILFELGQPFQGLNEQELRLQFTAAVRELGTNESALVLLVDEAHTVAEAALDELRAMTNLVAKGHPLVRILLSGQFPLEETLATPRLDSLNQRIACHATLEPLTRAESANYIEYRLKQAGAGLREVFTADALQTITFAADGNPRCLNQLCDRSLSVAAQYGVRPVPDSIVRRALADLKQLPLHWNDPPPAKGQDDLDDLDDTILIPPTSDESTPTPLQSEAENCIAMTTDLESEPQGEAAVVEFGADIAPTERPIEPTTAATVEFGAGVFEADAAAVSVPNRVSKEKPTPRHDLDDAPWTSVETRVTGKESPKPAVKSPDITFGKTVAAGMLRSLAKQRQNKPTESSEGAQLDEIAVNDHYAAILNEQRRPRDVQPVPVVTESVEQSEPETYPIVDSAGSEDCPSRLLLDDLHPEPDELIDSVMAAVQRAADVESDSRPVNSRPERTGTREIDAQPFEESTPQVQPYVPLPAIGGSRAGKSHRAENLPPLQDLLNEVEFDIVRPLEEDEPETPAASEVREDTATLADAPRPYIDLFTRLRRLQNSE